MTTDTSPNAAGLPASFVQLVPFVDKWALDDGPQRSHARASSSMVELREFYGAMLPVASDVAESLRGVALEDLDQQQVVLLKLLLSLAEVAVAVECFGQPTVPDALDQARFVPVFVPNMTPMF